MMFSNALIGRSKNSVYINRLFCLFGLFKGAALEKSDNKARFHLVNKSKML